jgi:16S rRNA (uracil1498-N3)-methyltransferase
MARFFVSGDSIKQNKAVITGSDAKHIARVLRLLPGEVIWLAAGDNREFAARITKITNQEVVCEIIAGKEICTEPPVQITLYQGLPKGGKMELVVQKSTELGVSRIVPVICERTIVRLDPAKADQRRIRWQRIAAEAAKQSRRTVIPEVSEPLTLDKALEQLSRGVLALMPWEEEIGCGIGAVLKKGIKKEAAVFIGPEGGFSRREADLARSNGVFLVSLGPRIIRTETAGIVALAVILYELGDLGGVNNG